MNDQLRNINRPQLRFSEFSEDWREKRLGDIGEYIGGGTPDTSIEEYWQGDIPWISSSDIMDGSIHKIDKTRFITEKAIAESATKLIPKGSVLMVSRVGIGKFAVADENLCTSQDFTNLVTDENEYFIGYYFGAKANRFVSLSQGTSIKGFTTKDIKSAKFSIPTLPEQTKIATFLTAVDKHINLLQKKKAELEQYKKGVMQKLFSVKTDYNPSLRFKKEDGSDFDDWEEKKLGEVGEFFSGGTPRSTNKKYYSGEIPFIGSGDISKNKVSSFITEEAFKSCSAKMVKDGDILYALYGATSGEVAISKINGAINQAVLCIRSKENPYYLREILNFNKGNIVSKYLQGGQGNLSANIVRNLKFNFPEIQEQQKVANFLSSIDKSIENITHQIDDSIVFKKGLLQKMFV